MHLDILLTYLPGHFANMVHQAPPSQARMLNCAFLVVTATLIDPLVESAAPFLKPA
jgi:hypothetical protein